MAKPFEAHPVRTLRASDKTWKRFLTVKGKKNMTWDKLLNHIADKLLQDK